MGGHREALASILDDRLDAAAIDANVWRTWKSENPEAAAGLRSIDALGPHPVQPVVVRTAVSDQLIEPIGAALRDPSLLPRIRPYGVTGFAEITDADYDIVAAKVRAAKASLGA